MPLTSPRETACSWPCTVCMYMLYLLYVYTYTTVLYRHIGFIRWLLEILNMKVKDCRPWYNFHQITPPIHQPNIYTVFPTFSQFLITAAPSGSVYIFCLPPAPILSANIRYCTLYCTVLTVYRTELTVLHSITFSFIALIFSLTVRKETGDKNLVTRYIWCRFVIFYCSSDIKL